MLKHKTSIALDAAPFSIHYQDTIVSMGSCFAENMAQYLKDKFYNINSNPFGTLYNPLSIRNSLGLLLNHYEFQKEDLFQHHDLWHSFQHHSSFSSTDPTKTLENINVAAVKARMKLQEANVLILTLGTAWVYELKATNQVVSNCHKVPSNRFRRKRLTVEEIVESLGAILAYLQNKNPALQIILTVSPIRHLKDGFVENQLSKSILLLAVQEMVQRAHYIHYFPAYEIMMDDLRDYRYYADDLVHPSRLAIDYIWELFSGHYLTPKEATLRKKLTKLQTAMTHRPFNPHSEAHQKFIRQQLQQIETIHKKVPFINLDTAIQHFQQQLITS